MCSLPRLTLLGLVLLSWVLWPGLDLRAAGTDTSEEVAVLKKADVASDNRGLLEFFRKRTVTGAYQERIDALIRQLTDSSYFTRRKAGRELVGFGAPALPALRRALKESVLKVQKGAPKDSELELQIRTAKCIRILAEDPGPALPLAALRLIRVRKPAEGCSVLLGYVPFADNQEVEEEVLESLQVLATDQGKANAVLMAGLQDKHPVRRSAAAFVVGRIGDLNQRAAVRKLLGDAESRVRLRAGQGIISKEIYDAAEHSAKADEKLLTEQKFPTDEAGLLEFFKKRTLSEADVKRLRGLVRQLGSKSYKQRNQATVELTKLGSAALPFLRPALQDPDVEIKERAAKCKAKIESGPATALPAAAVRLLRLRSPAKALQPLLAYLPFADDDMVEEEVLSALCVLNLREAKLSPVLLAEVRHAAPARRAAAAYVLGRVGTREDFQPLHKLLADADAKVRFHAARVLLVDRNKAALPVLVSLVGEGPLEVALKAEDILASVRGQPISKVELSENNAARRKVGAAWSAWWKANENNIDLSRLELDSEAVKIARARKITEQCLQAFLHLDKAGFKKTLNYPLFFEGMGPQGDGLVRSGKEVDQFFAQYEMVPKEAREELKQMSFKVRKVGRVDEFVKKPLAMNRGNNFFENMRKQELAFLKKMRKQEVYIVYITATRRGMPERGGGAVTFVRVVGGRAWVVGLGSDRTEEGRDKKK